VQERERAREKETESLLTRCCSFISRWNQIFITHSTDRQSTSQQQSKIAYRSI